MIAPGDNREGLLELTEQELLALAITLEEEDNRTYSDFAEPCATRTRARQSCSARWPTRRTGIVTASSISTAEIWRTYPVDPPPGREGFRRAKVGLAVAPARSRQGARASRADAGGEQAVLPAGGPSFVRCLDPSSCWLSRGGGEAPRREGRTARVAVRDGRGGQGRASIGTAPLSAADRAAGSGRSHGRVGLDFGAALRRRLCHQG